METLPKDVIVKLALELENEDILKLCSSSKRYNEYVCKNEKFWLNKIRKEYPYITDIKSYKKNIFKRGITYKEIYETFFGSIVANIEIDIYHNEKNVEKLSRVYFFPLTESPLYQSFLISASRYLENELDRFPTIEGQYSVYVDGRFWGAALKKLQGFRLDLNENTKSIHIIVKVDNEAEIKEIKEVAETLGYE